MPNTYANSDDAKHQIIYDFTYEFPKEIIELYPKPEYEQIWKDDLDDN